jgi:hypothetical protein
MAAGFYDIIRKTIGWLSSVAAPLAVVSERYDLIGIDNQKFSLEGIDNQKFMLIGSENDEFSITGA